MKPKITRSIRISEEMNKEAKALGLDISLISALAVTEAIKKTKARLGKHCPTCARSFKRKRAIG